MSYKFSASDLKKKIEDNKKDSYDFEIDNIVSFIYGDKEKQSIVPCILITTDNMEEILIRFNSNTSMFTIMSPQNNISFTNMNSNIEKNINNADVVAYAKELNKNLKGVMVSGETNIDDINEDRLLDILNVAIQSDHNLLNEPNTHIENIKNILRESKKKQSAKNESSQEKLHEKALDSNSISEKDYGDFCKRRTAKLNKEMDAYWRSVKYDTKNNIQEEITERFGEGQNIILMGDSGIGKTFNPEYIAKQNEMGFAKIALNRSSDSVELLGKPSFRANPITGEQEMYYDYGFLPMAFKEATKGAVSHRRGFVLVLDELYRAEDMTPFISNLSINSDGEYVLSIDESNTFAKINTNEGDLWFCVNDDISRDKQTYDLEDGKITMLQHTNPLYKFNGNESQAAERHFRGELLTLHREDFKEVLSKNRRSIAQMHTEKTKIYTPQRAISIVGTTNIGENYEVNMGADNALLSRLNPVLTSAPPIAYMVNQTVEKIAPNKNWTASEEKMIKQTIKNFASAIKKVFKNNKSIENPQKINFRMLDDIVSAIAPEKPFADGRWSIEKVLKRSAIKFLTIDSSLTADEIKDDPIIEAVIKGAENALEYSSNPAFKGVSEESLHQSAPAFPDDDDVSPGVRL